MRPFGALRDRLDRGELSAGELLAQRLEAIEARNPELNALVTLCPERATNAADRADRRRQEGRAGLLDGIPFSVKDVIAVGGVRMTAGSRLYADHVPRVSAPAVERLEAAGAVLVGKANCPEFGLDPHTDNLIFGATKNPIDAGRTPGGSSGGDAAAVAAGLVSFGIGSDYGGSIRWPAHCTGTVGFRPSVGVVPGSGHFPFVADGLPSSPNSASFLGGVQTIAPIAPSVGDAWAVLATMAGPDGLDPFAQPIALGDPAEVDVSTLRCAWADNDGSTSPSTEVADAVAHAAAVLAALPMPVSREDPPGLEQCEGIYAAHREADGLELHRAHVAGRDELLSETMQTWFGKVGSAAAADIQLIAGDRDRVRAMVLEFMETKPILLLPVANQQAWEVGKADFDERFRTLTPCRAVSLLGLPSCALPVATSTAGLPLAVQIVGRPYRDHEVAAVAHRLEIALRA